MSKYVKKYIKYTMQVQKFTPYVHMQPHCLLVKIMMKIVTGHLHNFCTSYYVLREPVNDWDNCQNLDIKIDHYHIFTQLYTIHIRV